MLKLLPLILLAAVTFSGCASESGTASADRVSTIPWNRPQSWEGQGAMGMMGGFMPGSQ